MREPLSNRAASSAVLSLFVVAVLAMWLLVAAPAALADPPTFTSVPSDILVEATGPDGAYVEFTPPTASDDNGAPDISCDSNSGDLFPVGQTTVNCTATDIATDETTSTSFQVQVLPKAQEEAASGAVRALFYYTKTTSGGLPAFKNLSLTILRSSTIAFNGSVPSVHGVSLYPAGYGQSHSVSVRDLDGNTEPEVLLDLYSGGAHCCFFTDIYRYDGTGYSLKSHPWGDVGYRLVDLNGDGRPEFLSGDDRFAYAFSDYADSAFPIQIWTYSSGQFTNVTRQYPALIRRDAARDWRGYLQLRRAHRETEGVVAAWAADEYLLHHRQLVSRRITRLARTGKLSGNFAPRHFLHKLRLFLIHHGYG
jgi:HYR domain